MDYVWHAYTRHDPKDPRHWQKLYDAVAHGELQGGILSPAGYSYAGVITATPHVTVDKIANKDLVVMTTRIPEDAEDANKTLHRRGDNPIEAAFEERLYRRCFERCTRDYVRLRILPNDPFKNRRSIAFHQYRSKGSFGLYRELGGRPCSEEDQKRTCGWLLFTPNLIDDTAGLVCAGPSGNSTLLFNVLLRTQLRDRGIAVVQHHQPHFFMAEFTPRCDVVHGFDTVHPEQLVDDLHILVDSPIG